MKSHIRTAPARLLIYAADIERTELLRKICSETGMQASVLSPGHLGETVGSLADRPLTEFTGNDRPTDSRECIIFCGAAENNLDKALESIRKNIPGGISLKAVLTASNRKMTLEQLITELEREHSRLHE